MDISITRLQADQRDIVTIRQTAKGGASSRGSYILCRPIGQEATRTSAMYRVISERLSREGCDTWRFDYHGTGDSQGEERDQTMQAWLSDILAVHEHVKSQHAGPVRWFGMGLGANLALMAADQATAPPEAIVAWEPVLSGVEYRQTLLQAHRDELAREFGYGWPQLKRQGRVSEPVLPGDVLGFDYGPDLADELLRIDSIAVPSVLRRGVKVMCALQPQHRALWDGQWTSNQLHWHSVESKTDWMSSQAMGAAIVPPDALKLILKTLS